MAKFKKPKITMYTSEYCMHSRAVEGFMARNDIPVKMVNIDSSQSARKKVMEINEGHASVPTLVFPNGDSMTEPSMRRLREHFNIQRPSIWKHLKSIFSN